MWTPVSRTAIGRAPSGTVWTVVLILLAPKIWSSPLCPLSFQSGSPISGIDAIRGSEWGDSSHLESIGLCFDQMLDQGSVVRNLAAYTKRYTRSGAGFFGFFFEVEDSSAAGPCSGGELCMGERIVLQFDPNNSGGTQLQDGASAIDKDYKIEITHRWHSSVADPNVVDDVEIKVFDGSGAPGLCGHPRWNDVTSSVGVLPVAVVRKDFPGGYKVELEVPLALLGNPSADVGVAFAVINDFGTCDSTSGVCDGYGSSFPNDLPVTNADNPVVGCQDSWSTPETWATGYFAGPPTDVWLSRVPKHWKSEDVNALHCGTVDNRYYPAQPCKLQVAARLRNSGSTDQIRNVVYLRGDHAVGVTVWSVVDLKEGVTIPAGSSNWSPDYVSQETSDVPFEMPGHPCVRVVILPPAFRADFDRARILAINSSSDVNDMIAAYGLGSQHWAQMNISRQAAGSTCPFPGCGVPNGGDDAGATPGPTPTVFDEGTTRIASTRPSAFSVSESEMDSLLASSTPPAAQQRRVPAHTGRVSLGQVVVPAPIGDEPDEGEVVIQVTGYGYSEPGNQQPRYNFLEEIGGIVQIFPVAYFDDRPEIPLRFGIGNPSPIPRTIFLVVEVEAPPEVRVKVDLDTSPRLYLPGEKGLFSGTVTVTRSRFGAGVLVGRSWPLHSFSNNYDVDTSYSLAFEYRVTHDISLEALFAQHRFKAKSGGSDLEMNQFSGNVKWFALPRESVGRIWRTYFNGGGGYYDFGSSSGDPGVNFGAGGMIEARSNIFVDIAFNYHWVFGRSDTVQFSALQAGVRFRF